MWGLFPPWLIFLVLNLWGLRDPTCFHFQWLKILHLMFPYFSIFHAIWWLPFLIYCNTPFIMQTLSTSWSYVSISWQECKPVRVVKLFSVGSKTPTHKRIVGHYLKTLKCLRKKKKGGGGVVQGKVSHFLISIDKESKKQ